MDATICSTTELNLQLLQFFLSLCIFCDQISNMLDRTFLTQRNYLNLFGYCNSRNGFFFSIFKKYILVMIVLLIYLIIRKS